MLGYDVKYFTSLSDKQLIETAKIEDRVLLSSDLTLFQQAKKQGVNVILIEGETVAEKLTTLGKQSDLKFEFHPSLSRCPKCNTRVIHIPKYRTLGRVPQGTFTHYSEFWECLTCHQLYWRGSHWKHIDQTLKQIKQILQQ
jgi:uncharacterized protein with PIN domain